VTGTQQNIVECEQLVEQVTIEGSHLTLVPKEARIVANYWSARDIGLVNGVNDSWNFEMFQIRKELVKRFFFSGPADDYVSSTPTYRFYFWSKGWR
jgi:hypothetical protein